MPIVQSRLNTLLTVAERLKAELEKVAGALQAHVSQQASPGGLGEAHLLDIANSAEITALQAEVLLATERLRYNLTRKRNEHDKHKKARQRASRKLLDSLEREEHSDEPGEESVDNPLPSMLDFPP